MTLLNEADKIYIGDTQADRVYLGANLVWEPAPVGGGEPTDHLVQSFGPPQGDRQDFTGEVGFIFKSIVNKPYSWLGLRCTTGNTGLHRVHLYDWSAPDTPFRTVDINLTGKAVGEWGWAPIAPVNLVASQFYVLMKEVVSGGPLWVENSPMEGDRALTDFWKSTYRAPGGVINQNTSNWQYVGLDIGWD